MRPAIEPIQSDGDTKEEKLRMATFDLFDSIHESERTRRISAPASFFAPLVEAWQAFRRRFEERQIIVKLSRKDAHLLRDMGFDPDEIYDAVHNSWDEVPVSRRRAGRKI
jgi:uncharacterized protein YjiS (DUF1127 family)